MSTIASSGDCPLILAASATVLDKYFFDISEVLNPTINIPSGGCSDNSFRISSRSLGLILGSFILSIQALCPPSCTHVGITPVKPVELAL